MGRSIKKQYYHAIGRLKCIYYDLGAHWIEHGMNSYGLCMGLKKKAAMKAYGQKPALRQAEVIISATEQHHQA